METPRHCPTGYHSCGSVEKLEAECKQAAMENESLLNTMNDLHSLLSLVRHRHLPRGMDSLEKDIDKALGVSDKALQEWWLKEMKIP